MPTRDRMESVVSWWLVIAIIFIGALSLALVGVVIWAVVRLVLHFT